MIQNVFRITFWVQGFNCLKKHSEYFMIHYSYKAPLFCSVIDGLVVQQKTLSTECRFQLEKRVKITLDVGDSVDHDVAQAVLSEKISHSNDVSSGRRYHSNAVLHGAQLLADDFKCTFSLGRNNIFSKISLDDILLLIFERLEPNTFSSFQ